MHTGNGCKWVKRARWVGAKGRWRGFREAEVKVSNYLLSIAITHSSETN